MTTTQAAPEQLHVSAARRVTVRQYAAMSGKSEAAVRKKIERGIWVERKQYWRDPEGCIWIDTKGVDRWIEGLE